MIEAGEHLGLIGHTVRRLHVPSYLHDEAYSEGLVVLAVAAAQYDPERGVPEGAYLAQRLRWGLVAWMRREIKHASHELDEERHHHSHGEEIEARRVLDCFLYQAARKLHIEEYVSLLGLVYGASTTELSQILRRNGTQLSELREQARAKLVREDMRLL